MEKPTFTARDYNFLENKIIEDRIRVYYPEIKHILEEALHERSRNSGIPVGLCADLIYCSKSYEYPINLWREVIKPWFTPQRFNIEYLYFGYYHQLIESIKDDILNVNGRVYFRVPIERLKGHEYLLGTAFWFPLSEEYDAIRIKILECALEDLERIKNEGVNPPPITFDEPSSY